MNILTIGNSFSNSLNAYFPQVAESVSEKLNLQAASFGGCELERHWAYIEAEENNPVCRIYRGGASKLSDILQSENWDIVTIQQASAFSWRAESYEPYAENIIAYIKKHAPSAEIIIQQTWAYRADAIQLQKESDWNLNQQQMFELLKENYRKMGERHNCRIIPTGLAVQLARENEERKFKCSSKEYIEKLRWPDLPPQASDVVGKYYWTKNLENGELEIKADLTHLNCRGEYLQACLWLAFIYQRKCNEISFIPNEIADSDAKFLQNIAQKALVSG